jgi:thiosulfate/3-mercaptopyruvate sulfurtransferase
MDTLVSTDWLNQHLDDPDLVILDCSVYQEEEDGGGFHNVSGLENYNSGHIPTAGFADLKGDLSDTSSAIEFAVPTPEQFCTAMGRLGVGDDTRVVLYDTSYTAWAARVWWMLRWVGFDNAGLLDGGFKAWTDEGRPVSTEPASHPERQLTPRPRPELIADKAEVLSAIEKDDVQLIDTLPPAMYRGEQQMYARPGHIPGATNSFGLAMLDETSHFQPDENLKSIIREDPNRRNITYCGGGILASLNAFAMTRQGYKDVAVYTASLQEWAADPELPMES